MAAHESSNTATNGCCLPLALRKSGMSARISIKEGTSMLAPTGTTTEVFMRFSFSFVVWQPYSKGERPPCLTLNRPCAGLLALIAQFWILDFGFWTAD